MVTTSDLTQDVELVKNATVAAGILALGLFRGEVKSWTKQGASPVSEADIKVDEYLGQVLRQARPDYGWLSEESGEAGRLISPRVFVVDPIDGTRAFIGGEDGWVISVAIVEKGTPVVGVIYAPVRDELYDAVLGGGGRLNGRPIEAGEAGPHRAIIPAPRSVHRELSALGLDYRHGKLIPSLAYRLMQVANGEVDAVATSDGVHDWDIAAATLILSECGIALEDVCAGPPLFDRAETTHGALAATRTEALRPALHAALKAAYDCPPESRVEPERERR